MALRAAIAALVLMGSAPAVAGGWEFSAAPYLLLPNMGGKSEIGRFSVNVDVDPTDIFSHLNIGGMALLNANNGTWGVGADLSYMNLDTTSDERDLSINGHQGAYAFQLERRVHPMVWAYAGARVNDIGARLEGTGPLGNGRDARRGATWVDPIVGFHAAMPFSDKWRLNVTADMGGFGAASDFVVNFWPTVGLRMGKGGEANVGYRVIYMNYETGSGDRHFVYDVVTFGPTIGFKWTFGN